MPIIVYNLQPLRYGIRRAGGGLPKRLNHKLQRVGAPELQNLQEGRRERESEWSRAGREGSGWTEVGGKTALCSPVWGKHFNLEWGKSSFFFEKGSLSTGPGWPQTHNSSPASVSNHTWRVFALEG